jgi:RND family efflux transporter MFP subunit
MRTWCNIGLGLALFVCGPTSAQVQSGTSVPPADANATSHGVENAPIPCLIEPHRLIKLATPVPGVLDQVLVDRGDPVTKGMLLARLESGVEEADTASARIRAEDNSTIQAKEARRDFTEGKRARLEQLRQSSQYVATTTYAEAEADARQARAELKQATIALQLAQVDVAHAVAKLGQRAIYSPVDGVVTERSLSPGEYAYDQASVLTVAELDPLNVEAFLPVAQYGSIKLGSKMRVLPQAPIGGSYTATVTIIDPVIDSRSGTFGVRLLLTNPGHVLPGGIRCELLTTTTE